MEWIMRERVDLARPQGLHVWPDALMVPGDSKAHRWCVSVYQDGAEVDLTGWTIVGYITRCKDDAVVPVPGTVSGCEASVVFDAACYVERGELYGIMEASKDDVRLTLACGRWRVARGYGNNVADPGDVIPSLAELLAEIANMRAATQAAQAATQSALAAADASVRTDVQQELTDAQMQQARDNIGAASIGDLAQADMGASAPPIVINASGKLLQTPHAAAGRALVSLHLLGQCVQATPNVDTPAEIVSPGDRGGLRLELSSANLYNPANTGTVTNASSKAKFTIGDDGWIDVTSQKKYDYVLNTRYFAAGLRYTLRVEAEVYDRPTDSTAITKIAYGIDVSKTLNVTANGSYTCFYEFTPETEGFYSIITHANAGSAEPAKVRFRTTCLVGSYTEDNMPAWVPYGKQTLVMPYILRGVPVVSGGNYTDASGQQWITDEIDFDRGVYIRRTKQLSLDGSGTWKVRVADTACIYQNLEEAALSPGANVKSAVMCDRLAAGSYSAAMTGSVDNVIAAYGGTLYINLPNEYNTVDAATAWLNDHPLEVVYAIAVPEEEQLSAELLAAYADFRTPRVEIADGAVVQLGYIADTKAYIDAKFQELANYIFNM